MTDTINTIPLAKMVLHAVKYQHCAVNGILLADAARLKDGARNQDVEIVEAVPLFHHSHYVSPMAEVALAQIDAMAQANKKVIAGYYAACENYDDNTIDKCPGVKIAEKIAENFPSALFVVIDNKQMTRPLGSAPINVYKWTDGKWKLKDPENVELDDCLEMISQFMGMTDSNGLSRLLIDFDNYLDDVTKDWSNTRINAAIESARNGKSWVS